MESEYEKKHKIERERFSEEKHCFCSYRPFSRLLSREISRMSSANVTTSTEAAKANHSTEKLSTNKARTPLGVATSASELAAANAATLRRRVLGVAAAELRALPAGRVRTSVAFFLA